MKAEHSRQLRRPTRPFYDLGHVHAQNVGQSHIVCQAPNVGTTRTYIVGLDHNWFMAKATTIGQRLKELRKAHPDKLTQYDVAAAAGISRSHYTKIELDDDPVGRETLGLLAAFFGVTMDYLETGADPTGEQVPDESFGSEDKRAWLLVGATLGEVGRLDVFRYLREKNSPRRTAESERRSRNKK